MTLAGLQATPRKIRSHRKSQRSFQCIGDAHPALPKKVDEKKMKHIKKPSFRRIARRAGVKRVSGDVYNELRKTLYANMSKTLHDATAVMSSRKTLSKDDILFALKHNGRVLYT